MYVVAIIADIIGLIPIVNLITDAVASIALGMIGSATGVDLYGDSQIGMTLFTIVIKGVPIADFVPMWTIRVYLAKRGAAKRRRQERQS